MGQSQPPALKAVAEELTVQMLSKRGLYLIEIRNVGSRGGVDEKQSHVYVGSMIPECVG